MGDDEREHNELQHRLGDILAWIRQREGRDERVSDDLFHLVHTIEFRMGIELLRGNTGVRPVTDPQAYAVT